MKTRRRNTKSQSCVASTTLPDQSQQARQPWPGQATRLSIPKHDGVVVRKESETPLDPAEVQHDPCPAAQQVSQAASICSTATGSYFREIEHPVANISANAVCTLTGIGSRLSCELDTLRMLGLRQVHQTSPSGSSAVNVSYTELSAQLKQQLVRVRYATQAMLAAVDRALESTLRAGDGALNLSCPDQLQDNSCAASPLLQRQNQAPAAEYSQVAAQSALGTGWGAMSVVSTSTSACTTPEKACSTGQLLQVQPGASNQSRHTTHGETLQMAKMRGVLQHGGRKRLRVRRSETCPAHKPPQIGAEQSATVLCSPALDSGNTPAHMHGAHGLDEHTARMLKGFDHELELKLQGAKAVTSSECHVCLESLTLTPLAKMSVFKMPCCNELLHTHCITQCVRLRSIRKCCPSCQCELGADVQDDILEQHAAVGKAQSSARSGALESLLGT